MSTLLEHFVGVKTKNNNNNNNNKNKNNNNNNKNNNNKPNQPEDSFGSSYSDNVDMIKKETTMVTMTYADESTPLTTAATTTTTTRAKTTAESENGEEEEEDYNSNNNNNENSSVVRLENKLTAGPLAVIIFYGVSGGCFGVEETVRSAGNFYTLLGFAIMPWVWAVQESMVTAELSAAYPEASGSVAWVTEAFGELAGFMNGYLSWVSGATDNAIYPVLFVEYLLQSLSGSSDQIPHFYKFFCFTVIALVLAYTNWLGLNVVGKMSIVICCVAVSPFVVLSVIGAFQVDPERWFMLPPGVEDSGSEINSDGSPSSPVGLFSFAALGAIAWRPYLNNMYWNLNSFDKAACFAADVHDPGHTMPRALGWAIVMVGSCYFIPLFIALGASHAPPYAWVDGYFSVVAERIAGNWLGAWLVFAAGISNVAMFQAELSSDSFMLLGMAERGYLPKIFATRSVHGTPTYGIILGTLVIICMTVTSLENLIEMLNFTYAITLIQEYLAFLHLRVTKPDLVRPWRVPLGTVGCAVVLTPTLIAILAVMILASVRTWLFSISITIFGIALFWLEKHRSAIAVYVVEEEFREETHAEEVAEEEERHHVEETPIAEAVVA